VEANEYPTVHDGNFGPSAPHQPQFGHRKKTSVKKRVLLIAVIVIVLLGLGGGTAVLLSARNKPAAKSKTASNSSSSNTSAAKQPSSNVAAQDNGGTYTYKSTTLNIGVTYPKTWTLRENADKSEMTLTSPQTSYTKKDGTSTEGVFTLHLRNGSIPAAMVSAVNGATAVADSVIVAYSQPTSAQRQYTNVSYAGPDANNFTFLVVTGSTAFKAGQAFGGSVDLSGTAYLFAGGYGSDSGDALVFDQVPKTAYDTLVFQEAVKIIEGLQIY
jgi:cytoskeletal protein RodZ